MRLKRKVDDYLIEWKNNKNRLPLIIKGARQIGKTDSIRNFGLNHYKSFIEINFVLQPEYKDIFVCSDLCRRLKVRLSLLRKAIE